MGICFSGFDDWIEIFMGGRQRSSSGQIHDGDRIIDNVMKTFDPKYYKPPIVIGHPKNDAPEHGTVDALKTAVSRGAKILLMKAGGIAPEFEEMVRNGLYRNRSIKLFSDGRLRHVGFLGAQPPAVKGLAELSFCAFEEHGYEFIAEDDYLFQELTHLL